MARALSVTEDASPGEWIAPRLGGEFGVVTLAVPSGYEAYARICHPASDGDGCAVSWSEVAEATGRTAHPLMQWHTLVGSSDPFNFAGSLWRGGDPEWGNLAPAPLEVLCELLGKHTAAAEDCFVAVWDGWAWVHGGGVNARFELVSGNSKPKPAECAPPAFSEQELSRPRLVLPGRDYVLLTGPLSAVRELGDRDAFRERFEPRSPNLLWPADRAWCIASEIDFDSTLVGGSSNLIEAVLESPGLDSWRVGPDDSLAADADHINRAVG